MESVNVLLYPEPTVFPGQIEKNINLIDHFYHYLITPLRKVKSRRYKFWIVCNEFQSIGDDGHNDCIQLIKVTQRELTNNWKYEPFKLIELWQTGAYDETVLEYYCDLFRTRIPVTPDIIFSVYEAPFLRKLYNDTLFLGIAAGIITRSPFPHTTSFIYGNLGRPCECYLAEYWDTIKQTHRFDDDSKKLISRFKETYKNVLIEKSPFTSLIKEYKEKFDYLYLMPFTIPYNTYIDYTGAYKSELHFLIDVLEKTPDNIGIIVTTHPRTPDYPDTGMIEYLGKKYANFIHDVRFSDYLNASQFILPEIDGVICISSNTAYLSMVFDKKIVFVRDGFFSGINDASDITGFMENLDKPAIDKDEILFWYLTRFCISSGYYFDCDWLDDFIQKSIEKHKQGNYSDFYDLIDEPKAVIENLIDNIDTNIPQLSMKTSSDDIKNITSFRYIIPVELNTEIPFTMNSLAVFYIYSGFALPEQTHAWTISERAEIRFPIGQIFSDIKIVIKGTKLMENQRIELEVNDKMYGEISGHISEFTINAREFQYLKFLSVKIHSSPLNTPLELGLGNDVRTLGYRLESIGLYEQS